MVDVGADERGNLLQVVFVVEEDRSVFVIHARPLTEAAPPSEALTMTPPPATSKYLRMNAEELAAATAELDREMVISQSRALASSERRTWQEARRKPGRPRRGAGVKVISVSVERGLLSKSDALASRLGVSRAALIERGLRLVLAGRLGGLSATRAEVPVAEAQRAELDRRSRALDRALARGQNPGEPADEVVRRIRARR